MKKKMVALLMLVFMVLGSVAGCGKFEENAVVAEINGVEVTADVANFYARSQQATYDTYYLNFMGEEGWKSIVDGGKTMETSVKESILRDLEAMYLLEEKQAEYNISLSDAEKEKITETAKTFVEANGEAERGIISGSLETIERVLTLMTIKEKMREPMVVDVDTNVSDEEAAQKKIEYVQIALTTTDENGASAELSEEERADLKEKITQVSEKVRAGGEFATIAKEYELEVLEATFDSDSTFPAAEVVQAADKLKEGETTRVIETATMYYVAKLVSLLDREATDVKKDDIVSARKEEAFQALCDEWIEAADITVHNSVWRKISFARQGVTIKTAEVETEDVAE